MSEVSQPNLIETIERALAQAKKGRYHVGVIADEWLRALLEENKQLNNVQRQYDGAISAMESEAKEMESQLQQTREELERSRGSHMFQYGLSLELEIKRLKAELSDTTESFWKKFHELEAKDMALECQHRALNTIAVRTKEEPTANYARASIRNTDILLSEYRTEAPNDQT